MNKSMIAGVLASAAGMLTFLVVHHILIVPIWSVLPLGLVLALLGGLAVGKAVDELGPRMPRAPWSVAAWLGLFAAVLAPTVIASELGEPILRVTNREVVELNVSRGVAIAVGVFDILILPAVSGALLGWLIGRTRDAAIATALVGVALAFGPGHNIPFLAGTPAKSKGLVLLFSVIAISAIALVVADVVLSFLAKFREPEAGERWYEVRLDVS